MESKHTPGPWVLMDTTNADGATEYEVEAPDYETVALVYASENMATNAALIAAAPDMYEALREAQAFVRDMLKYERAEAIYMRYGIVADTMYPLINNTLAKAEGR